MDSKDSKQQSIDSTKDIYDHIYDAVLKVEQEKGRAPYALEIMQELHRQNVEFDRSQIGFPLLLNKVLRDQKLFVNKEWNQFSSIHDDNYLSFFERLERTYPGYELNPENFTLKPTEAKTVNLEELIKVLLSDSKDYDPERYDWIFKGIPKLLDNSKIEGERISLATFPRTGNTFLRKVFQDLTGIATGSDFAIHSNLSLQMISMNGEGITDEQVWFVKTHHPIPSNAGGVIPVNKMIVTARNPLSIIQSAWNLLLTRTQDREIKENLNDEKYIKVTNEAFDFLCKRQQNFFKYYIEVAQKMQVPVHFIRYEDLVADKYNVLIDLFRFTLGVDSLKDTVIEKRIKQYVELGDEVGVVYKVKRIDFNKSVSKFTDDQITRLTKMCEDYLIQFGYCDHPKIQNQYGFYKMHDVDETKLEEFELFKKINQEHLRWVIDKKEELKNLWFNVNDPNALFPKTPQVILQVQMDVSIKE